MAELREACLGGGAGGVHGDDAATAAARGAAQDVDGEGVLVKRGPVEATGGTTLLRLRLRLRRRHWCWRWRSGDDWPQRGVRCVDAVEAGEVSLGRRHQRHETADELLGGDGQGRTET